MTDEAAPQPAQKNNTISGLLWLGFSGILFVGVTGIVRYIGSDVPPIEAAFIRYVFGLMLLFPIFLRMKIKWPKGRKLVLFSVRGLAHAAAVSLWFYAMARIPIADVIAIGYTAPIYVTIGAALFLGERLRFHRVLAIIAGFIGTLIILRPGLQVIEIGAIAQIIAAPIFAISFLVAKVLTNDEDSMTVVVMLSIFCTIALAPGAIMQWQTPDLWQFFWLAVVALFATLGHYAQTRSFQAAQITATQPVWFLQLVWGALMGYFVFGETIDPYVVLGATVIIIAVTYISHREARVKR
jgi:drug/metabolite transporter (DMT)-like permease